MLDLKACIVPVLTSVRDKNLLKSVPILPMGFAIGISTGAFGGSGQWKSKSC